MTKNKSTLALALGSVFVASLGASSVVSAAQNPFAMASLDKGYMVAAAAEKSKDGKCGEGKCGASKADKAKMKEGSCGADKAKMMEGNCGASKAAPAKMKDGKCGEGMCGATKK